MILSITQVQDREAVQPWRHGGNSTGRGFVAKEEPPSTTLLLEYCHEREEEENVGTMRPKTKRKNCVTGISLYTNMPIFLFMRRVRTIPAGIPYLLHDYTANYVPNAISKDKIIKIIKIITTISPSASPYCALSAGCHPSHRIHKTETALP